ncbi:MAG: SDR family oxidoreductase [Arcicella sp.]|nr:SDR family oxidoreductase [Arcicella sp.]
MSIKNKSVLITGASKGIGRALALLLAKKGANLSLVARGEIELLSLKAEIELIGSKAEIFIGSVADEDFVKQTTASIIKSYGKIDALVNNAGFGIFGKATEISTADWDSIYGTNVKGTFLFCREAIPHMKAEGGGHIVNVASDVAKRVFDGGSLYCSSKYAQDAFSMALRKEVRKDAIKVSVVYSGLVDTYFHSREEGDQRQAEYLSSQDMADAITYILEAPKHVVIDELMIHPISQEY